MSPNPSPTFRREACGARGIRTKEGSTGHISGQSRPSKEESRTLESVLRVRVVPKLSKNQ